MPSKKKGGETMMKGECPAWMSWVVLIVGILYLLQDLGVIMWWSLSWWTVAFLLMGLGKLSGK